MDSVSKVFGLFKELKNLKYGSKDLDIWEFLRNWSSQNNPKKYKDYDKYACHELNIFLYFQDKTFF